MIIEALTAYAAIHIIWDVLKIAHSFQVAYHSAKGTYQVSSKAVGFLIKKYQTYQDKKYPAQKLEREKITLYDLLSIPEGVEDAKETASQFLKDLGQQVGNLKEGLYHLDQSINALNSISDLFLEIKNNAFLEDKKIRDDDQSTLSKHLMDFKTAFDAFGHLYVEFHRYMTYDLPPRELLYFASLQDNGNTITAFNNHRKFMQNHYEDIEKKKDKIANLFKEMRVLCINIEEEMPHQTHQIPFDAESLKHRIETGINNNTIGQELSDIFEHAPLAEVCASLMQSFQEFKTQINAIHQDMMSRENIEAATNKENNTITEWKVDPAWNFLLTDHQQLQQGQRIFLDAMNHNQNLSKENKREIAQSFLHQKISASNQQQLQISQFTYELACDIRTQQIQQCDQLLRFLGTIHTQDTLPEADDFGLLDWLIDKRLDKGSDNAIGLLKEILVTPYLFGECDLESGITKFKNISTAYKINLDNKQLNNMASGLTWHAADLLFALPSFKTRISWGKMGQPDDSKHKNQASPFLKDLSDLLSKDISTLRDKLIKSRDQYRVTISSLFNEMKEKKYEQEKVQHQNGIVRIQKSKVILISISSKSNILHAYLDKTLSQPFENSRVPTVPTPGDLQHLIYKGLDPNAICDWNNQKSLISNFFPDQGPNDSRKEAWSFACLKCEADVLPIFSRLFRSSQEELLALPAPDLDFRAGESIVIQAIIKNKNHKKDLSISQALAALSPQEMENIGCKIYKLENYFVLAMLRINPNYRSELDKNERYAYIFKNFFKLHFFNRDISTERCEDIKVFMGNVSMILTEQNLENIKSALKEFEKNADAREKKARRKDNSELYSIIRALKEELPAAVIKLESKFTLETVQKLETALETERAEKEAALAATETERTEKEAALAEKEAALAEVKRLKALLTATNPSTPEPGPSQPVGGAPIPLAMPSTATLFKPYAQTAVIEEQDKPIPAEVNHAYQH